MPFQKGNDGLGGGRPAGRPNQKTYGVDALLRYVAEEGSDAFLAKLQAAGDDKYLVLFRDLLEYVKPKLQRVENKIDANLSVNLIREFDSEKEKK